MALTARKAALLLLRATFVLLCKLLLVDVLYSFVSNWLAYFLLEAKTLAPPHSNSVRSQDHSGIQVIICGISRSGCTSLWQAMDILGFPCFHGAHLFEPSTSKLFMKAQTSGSCEDWERLLHGYRSIVDFPAASSYKKLMEMYPKAKVILNMRDPEKWYNSFSQTILKGRQSLMAQVVQPCMYRCSKICLHQKILMDKAENKELSIANYKIHVEEVKRHVPSHKLYVLDIEKNEGWAPLCNFLEVPIPNVSFPFANKTGAFNTWIGRRMEIHIIVLLSYLALILSIFIRMWIWVFSM